MTTPGQLQCAYNERRSDGQQINHQIYLQLNLRYHLFCYKLLHVLRKKKSYIFYHLNLGVFQYSFIENYSYNRDLYSLKMARTFEPS